MNYLLELSDRDIKTTKTNYKGLVEKVDCIHEQMGNFSREMGTKKDSNGNLKDKHVISKIVNFFNRFILMLDTSEEITSKTKD